MSDTFGGVRYDSSAKKVIVQVIKPDLTSLEVPKTVVEIKGGSVLDSSFYMCRKHFKTLTFETGSQFTTFGRQVFEGSVIESADFRPCTNLKVISAHAFYGCAMLTTVYLPPNAVTLQGGCFASTGLTSIDIPDTVEEFGYDTELGSGVFAFSKLTSINFGVKSKLRKISHHALQGVLLTSFSFGEFFAEKGNYMFTGSKISHFSVSDANKDYSSDGTVLYNKDQTYIYMIVPVHGNGKFEIKDSVTLLKDYALASAEFSEIIFPKHKISLQICCLAGIHCKSIEMPDGTTDICSNCFNGAKISSIVLPDSVIYIRDRAFYNCKSLTNVTFSKALSTIENEAFSLCTGLRSIVIPRSVTSFGTSVFSGCDINLVVEFEDKDKFKIDQQMVICDGNKLVEYFGKDENSEITIPNSITSIGDFLFSKAKLKIVRFDNPSSMTIGKQSFELSTIKEIYLPSTLTSIGESCFAGSSITKVVWDGTETKISKSCFSGCRSLSTIEFKSKSIQVIDDYAFIRTPALTSFNFIALTSLTGLGKSCFEESGIQSAVLPVSLKSLGDGAFFKSSLAEVTFNSNINISKKCFESCSQLATVSLGQGVEVLEIYCFSKCTNLLSITISPATTEIHSNAFDECTALQYMTIPEGSHLKRIYPFVFEGCSKFTHLDVLDNNFAFDEGCLMNKAKTKIIFYLPTSNSKTFVVPSTIQTISEYAFSSCINLREIIISDGTIEHIGVNAFENCVNLIRLILPKSLTAIDQDAFIGCDKLKCGGVTFMFQNDDVKQQAIRAGINERLISDSCNGKNSFFDKITCRSQHSFNLHSSMFLLFFAIY